MSSLHIPSADPTALTPDTGLRFSDRTGRVWLAREIDATVPGRARERCLVFEATGVMRRVWNYPPSWRTLPPEALATLLDAR
jgi:hypothetical protein